MKIFGQVIGGMIVIDPPVGIPEGTIVEILPLDLPVGDQSRPLDPVFLMVDLAVDTGDPNLSSNVNSDAVARRMEAGMASGGIPDLGRNHDHYLYGHPKVEDGQADDQIQSTGPASSMGDEAGVPGAELEGDPDGSPADRRSLLYRMLDLAGPTGIPDLGSNIDHYLYGHPKVDDEQ